MANKAAAAVALIVGVFLVAILSAFLMPPAVNAISGDETTAITQNATDTDTVQPDLNVTLDSVTTDTDATYTVNASGDTATTSAITEGNNETVTVDGIDVTITVDEIDGDTVTATVAYPTDYGWSGGASGLWVVLPLIIVLTIFLAIIGMALDQSFI